MPIRRRLIAPILAIACAAVASQAAADCDVAGPPEEVLPTAQVAFVGRAIAVRGPVATFAVGEVWAGEIGNVVEVRGIIDQVAPNAVGEDDRQWVEGGTYLVIPFVDGAVLRDHLCTATAEWSDQLAALRPSDARIVASVADPAAPLPITVLVVAGVAAVVGLAALAFRHPRR